MVKLNSIQAVASIINGQKVVNPVMHYHKLSCKKSAPTFNEGESYGCYITSYAGGRFAVFTHSGVSKTSYHVFESEQELHNHFDEA